jgi:hypothetical protein
VSLVVLNDELRAAGWRYVVDNDPAYRYCEFNNKAGHDPDISTIQWPEYDNERTAVCLYCRQRINSTYKRDDWSSWNAPPYLIEEAYL